MFETVVAVGVPLLAKLAQMIEEAKTASAERSAEILAQLQAADASLDKTATETHALVEEETQETKDAIAAHKDPAP